MKYIRLSDKIVFVCSSIVLSIRWMWSFDKENEGDWIRFEVFLEDHLVLWPRLYVLHSTSESNRTHIRWSHWRSRCEQTTGGMASHNALHLLSNCRFVLYVVSRRYKLHSLLHNPYIHMRMNCAVWLLSVVTLNVTEVLFSMKEVNVVWAIKHFE